MQTKVAREHRICNSQVSNLVRKAQKNKKFLEELMLRQEEKEVKVDYIKSVVETMNDKDQVIESLETVC